MLDFYEMMLNIKKWDTKDVLTILNKTIKNEIEELINFEDKDFVLNLKEKLDSFGFRVKNIDIKDVYKDLKEHEILLLSYQDNHSKFNYILIDPIYNQFCKKRGVESPLYYEAWPGELLHNINPIFYKTLLEDKYCYVDDKAINDYFRSFTNRDTNITLENLLLDKYNNRKIR